MGEAIITRRGGGGKLKYAVGSATTAAVVIGTQAYSQVTVSGLDFKPYVAIAYAAGTNSSTIKPPSIAALDADGAKLLGLRGPKTTTSFYHDSNCELTNNGFTLIMGQGDYAASNGYNELTYTVTWIAWGI